VKCIKDVLTSNNENRSKEIISGLSKTLQKRDDFDVNWISKKKVKKK
jgi:two-component SAPR family response regulator